LRSRARCNAEPARHHEALAVVVDDRGEVHALAGIALQRPGGLARQDVDLARLQCREALRRRQRRDAHLHAVAEHGGRDRAAHVDVEAAPYALASGAENPAVPVLVPQASWPRWRTAASVWAPASDAGHEAASASSAVEKASKRIVDPPISFLVVSAAGSRTSARLASTAR
jgi:hypothetical protein